MHLKVQYQLWCENDNNVVLVGLQLSLSCCIDFDIGVTKEEKASPEKSMSLPFRKHLVNDVQKRGSVFKNLLLANSNASGISVDHDAGSSSVVMVIESEDSPAKRGKFGIQGF